MSLIIDETNKTEFFSNEESHPNPLSKNELVEVFPKGKNMIRDILHHCKRVVVRITKTITCLVPKDNNLVLFSAWFGLKYIDSSRYVFEYCLNNNLFKAYWYARSKELYHQLREKSIPVVYSNSIKGIIFHMRAKMLVSSVQLADFSPFLLGNCIYLDLGHGFPIKQSGFEQPDATQRYINFELLSRENIRYYMCSSSEWTKNIAKRTFRISDNQIVFCNKPRTDVLFDKSLREGKNTIVYEIAHGRRKIVYMPTHRSMGKVQLHTSDLLDLDEIQHICSQNNCVFLIKKHFYHRNEVEHLEQYENIFDITGEDLDPETLTYQADVMISDYSASYIDFLLLDRPIIFYAFDLEQFLKTERDLYLKFEDINAGFKPQTKAELNEALRLVCADWIDYAHKSGRQEVRKKYFDDDVPVGNSRESISVIMQQLIDGTYKTKWGAQK